MDYNKLVQSWKKLGASEQDIFKHKLKIDIDDIRDNVIIAPSWEPSVLADLGEAKLISPSNTSGAKVWNISNNRIEATFLRTEVTSPHLLQRMLPLGITDCKKIIFVGSVGSLDENIDIGDIILPKYAVCGDGASRYIASDDLKYDVFGEKVYPDSILLDKAMLETTRICKENNVKWHWGKTFSIDTEIAEYVHIDTIINMGCNSLEMETAAAFRAAKLMKIPLIAILVVSDNSLTKKSLLSGRTQDEMLRYNFVTKEIVSKIIMGIL